MTLFSLRVCVMCLLSVCVSLFFHRKVQVCVNLQQDFFKEAQPLALGLLGQVEHLLHVLHVARVAAVQLLQGLGVALLRLPCTEHTLTRSLSLDSECRTLLPWQNGHKCAFKSSEYKHRGQKCIPATAFSMLTS